MYSRAVVLASDTVNAAYKLEEKARAAKKVPEQSQCYEDFIDELIDETDTMTRIAHRALVAVEQANHELLLFRRHFKADQVQRHALERELLQLEQYGDE
jgi:hypothetical protein